MKFVGEHPTIEFVETGYYSLDLALRESYNRLGISTRTLTELIGPTSIGKSHFINSLAGVLGHKLERNVACLDLELQNQDTLERILNNAGFDNEWRWVVPGKKRKKKGKEDDDNDIVADERLLNALCQEANDNCITILDSVAAIVPVAEGEGDIGDRNIGARAFPMAQFSRLMAKALRYSPDSTLSFMANHRYKEIATGLPFQTYGTPGGQVKENMAHIRIEARVPYIPIGSAKKQGRFGNGWIFEGKVLKNRFGLSHSDFWVFIIGGQGIHFGLTAMFDCVKLGLAKLNTGATITLKSTGEELGRVTKIVEDRNNYDFSMFHNALKAHQISAQDDAELIERAKEEEAEYVPTDEDMEDE